MARRIRDWLSPYIHLSSNWLSRIGVVLVTTAFILWVFLLPTFLNGEVSSPYIGILLFMLLPTAFVAGLILIPIGIFLQARCERRKGTYPTTFVPLDFNNNEFRRLLMFVGIITIINFVVGSQLVYSGVNYMDSVTFCGTTCHSVMQPEYTAYLRSPHARVAYVQCHIGPGASWFVRSKLSGVHQVLKDLQALRYVSQRAGIRRNQPENSGCLGALVVGVVIECGLESAVSNAGISQRGLAISTPAGASGSLSPCYCAAHAAHPRQFLFAHRALPQRIKRPFHLGAVGGAAQAYIHFRPAQHVAVAICGSRNAL
jgi:hypothetical protein